MSQPRDILAEAVEIYKPIQAYLMFSGGHDSLATTHLSWKALRSLGVETVVAHINTGIGIPETREFVRRTVLEQDWKVIEATPPAAGYEEFVLRHGFPGPAAHRYAYSWLKERAVRSLVRQAKRGTGDRVLLVTGVRRQESSRRMGHIQAITRLGSQVWVAPIIDWDASEVRRYMAENNLSPNPVVDLLHMSGECLCGAFAKPGELDEIALWFPEVAHRIRALEHEVEQAGVAACRWGQRAPAAQLDGQSELFDAPFLCTSCERGAER